ncbi:hypothetical protein C1H46_036388 [Malus baccata]|uniref:Uncharacterized protein n=1 Tax=Malus baccata TaxID=106549 RepID=A0A540KV15_MALBA|nr:hypothetical protein C1H46_036388 [Malus baccata]
MGNADLKPDAFALSGVLPVFAEYVHVIKGKEIHGYAIRHGLGAHVFIRSSLIDMYANCTQVQDSLRVFKLLPKLESIGRKKATDHVPAVKKLKKSKMLREGQLEATLEYNSVNE